MSPGPPLAILELSWTSNPSTGNSEANQGHTLPPNRLVDEINHKIVTDSGAEPTSSTILGPFWSPETPFRENGDSVVQNMPPDGELTHFHGVIKDAETGKPIPNAVFDMWQASTNGKYDVFDPENRTSSPATRIITNLHEANPTDSLFFCPPETRHNLRGKFRTDADGKFWFYCLKPTEYAIDTSGPSAELLRIMGRHPHRPAHIHMMVTHDDYIGVTAQLYPSDDQYLETDVACAVKPDLLLYFNPVKDEKNGAILDVEYNVRLVSKKYKPDSTMLMQNANQNKF